ncbi:MAG: DUF427 domain-containing protein [Acidimicrobiia bacterium]
MTDILRRFKKADPSSVTQAVAGDVVVASAEQTVKLEGNHYFAPDAVNWDMLEASSETSVCPWKGLATYYDVVADGTRYPAAAWTYTDPSRAAAHIKDHIAFWRGVKVAKA